ncbi:MAG: polyprenyl synthetase family protein [bacterium]|nr:polyprenyl synthetase family protein [bacterium]
MQNLFNKRLIEATDIHSTYAQLWEIIKSEMLKGGKRIRPYLTMVGYGKYDDSIITVAVAQELIHLAMLIHDDIIDKDSFRRGSKNIIGNYKDIYSDNLTPAQTTHYANSAAMLAGDALISEAFRCLTIYKTDNAKSQLLIEQLHRSIFEVIGGELMDMEAVFSSQDNFDPISISQHKTAIYSFVVPLVSGAICSEADRNTINLLESIGIPLGIGFQLSDDLLGTLGDEKITGKSTTTDLREGKNTFLISQYKKLMNKSEQVFFEAVFGDNAALDKDLEKLKSLIKTSGACEVTESAIAEYFKQALSQIELLPNSIQRSELKIFTDNLTKRKS